MRLNIIVVSMMYLLLIVHLSASRQIWRIICTVVMMSSRTLIDNSTVFLISKILYSMQKADDQFSQCIIPFGYDPINN